MTFAVLGGIFLNIGAFLTYKGMIFRAVWAYLIADIFWVLMAWERQDWVGMVFIISGITFALLAFLKMHSGEMEKELKKEKI
ncbi:MAG: hypothetical protein DRG24_03275 [Epsilonproteobacteria bacterium]|nr:MAG: hypothetical protein DRG24_03275 [Campylobacterota bacterium]